MVAEHVAIEDIEGHLAWMQGRGLAINSLHTRLRSIKAWFNWMVQRKLITEDPSRAIRPPRLPKIRKAFVKGEQFNALPPRCPQSRLLGARRQAMLWLLLTSGIRADEMALLKVADVDWDCETIRLIHGKGQRERQIPFVKDAQRAMLRYFEQRELKGFDSERLWVSEEGRKFQEVGQDIGRLIKSSGVDIPDRCHAWRRTIAANAVRQHIPRPFVHAIAGWASPQMWTGTCQQWKPKKGPWKPSGGSIPSGEHNDHHRSKQSTDLIR